MPSGVNSVLKGSAQLCVCVMQAGAVFWNGRGDGDVRIGFFIEQQQAADIRCTPGCKSDLLHKCKLAVQFSCPAPTLAEHTAYVTLIRAHDSV